jgi:hypothetical protein
MHRFLFTGSTTLPPGMEFLTPYIGILVVLALLDVALKGWGMWRAARMSKKVWFIALLIVNSIGILPVIFLLLTNTEYERSHGKARRS